LKESQLKHGHELLKKHRPSDLVKGKSYPTLANPFQKEVIRYEAFPISKCTKEEKRRYQVNFCVIAAQNSLKMVKT